MRSCCSVALPPICLFYRLHYCEVYNWLHQPASCASCGARPKAGTRFLRHSPNPSLVSKLINQSAEMEIDLTAKDTICYSCYRVHLSLINSTQSSDEQLEEFMQIWLKKCNDCKHQHTHQIYSTGRFLVVGDNCVGCANWLPVEETQLERQKTTSENSTKSTDLRNGDCT